VTQAMSANATQVKRSFLSRATSGVVDKPPIIMVYGVPGVGKTTLAASIPRSAVMPVEAGGSDEIAVHLRLPVPGSWAEVLEQVRELTEEPHDCSALVIDTADALEALLIKHICISGKGKTINQAYGGYGAGVNAAIDELREFMGRLERLRDTRRMTIVLIAHSMVKTFHSPDSPDYDRYIPKMNEKPWGVLFETCGAVLFAHYEFANTATDTEDKGKVIATGKRFLRTNQGGAWEAKNRFGFSDPIELTVEAGWKPIADTLAAPKRIRAEIEAELRNAPPDLATTVRGWIVQTGSNARILQEGLDRLRDRLAAMAKPQEQTTTTEESAATSAAA